MITIATIPNECRTDHLFLLIGANPLPNFVAALLLRKANTTFHLLHTQQTSTIAENLRDRILNQHPDHQFELRQIDASDGESIRSGIKAQLASIHLNASVGLNYTGGTKVMAVHVYRAIETAKPTTVFSYLDAQQISLRIDGSDGRPTVSVPITSQCPMNLDTLARLHGYRGFKQDPMRSYDPKRDQLLDTILQIHLNSNGYEQWQKYIEQPIIVDLPGPNYFPELLLFTYAIEKLYGGSVSTEQAAIMLDNQPRLNSCRKWLMGGWLEEIVFAHIAAHRQALGITDLGRGLEPIQGAKKNASVRFEIDVAAMLGYQLFVASCIASTKKDKCEHHFFQVYTRARQLGGDELRAALVCLYEKPQQLQEKIDESWLTEGRVRVFGREHLQYLSDHLRNWISTANQ